MPRRSCRVRWICRTRRQHGGRGRADVGLDLLPVRHGRGLLGRDPGHRSTRECRGCRRFCASACEPRGRDRAGGDGLHRASDPWRVWQRVRACGCGRGAGLVMLADLDSRAARRQALGSPRACIVGAFALRGRLDPQLRLGETEVWEMFQVSRQPVREAFIKLVESGVLQVLPQRGTFVKKISPRRVREGRFIREAIEAAVARKAALEITTEQLADLAENLRDQKTAAKVNDTTSFLALDERFHFLIAQSIDCVAAWDTIQDIKAHMDRVRYLSLPEVSPLELLIKQHARIVSALKAHDADDAQ